MPHSQSHKTIANETSFFGKIKQLKRDLEPEKKKEERKAEEKRMADLDKRAEEDEAEVQHDMEEQVKRRYRPSPPYSPK